MPNFHEVQEEVINKKNTAQDIVRRRYLEELSNYTHRDTIIYASCFTSLKASNFPPHILSVNSQDITSFMSALQGLKATHLDLILHSPGGDPNVAEQIVQYLRKKYSYIRAIIPQNAMSAATMIACACDSIMMGKHSALGPIDPQVTFATPVGTHSAPAHSILREFEQARNEVMAHPRLAPLWLPKIQGYPPGILDLCVKAIELAQTKVGQWLNTYMFRDVPENEKLGVTIARWLGNADEHKTHGRPITVEKATGIGLKIDELEADQRLQELVLSVFHATAVTFEVSPCIKFVENHKGHGNYLVAATQPMIQAPPGRPA